jgi:hypothetical protein
MSVWPIGPPAAGERDKVKDNVVSWLSQQRFILLIFLNLYFNHTRVRLPYQHSHISKYTSGGHTVWNCKSFVTMFLTGFGRLQCTDMFLNTESQNLASSSTVECAVVHGNSHSLNCLAIRQFSEKIWSKFGRGFVRPLPFLLGLFCVNLPNFRLVCNMHASLSKTVKLVQSLGPKKNRRGTRSSPLSWMRKKLRYVQYLQTLGVDKHTYSPITV